MSADEHWCHPLTDEEEALRDAQCRAFWCWILITLWPWFVYELTVRYIEGVHPWA